MKLLTFILILFAVQTIAQDKSYLQLRKEYAEYCNQEVIDTIEQTGVITYEIGDELKLIPKDTNWYSASCNEYKENINNAIAIGTVVGGMTYSTYEGQIIPEFATKITRNKYCKCKLRPQSASDFWDWVEENYIKLKK